MKYAEARNLIKTGDLLAWRDHTGGPLRGIVERWIVRHSTASPHTHVGMAWGDHGRLWVMEITTKGCAPRLLSGQVPFDWVAAPRELSEEALSYAHSCFGEWIYSRWQAVLGALRRLLIGADNLGQCAEFVLAVWRVDGIAPTDTATPGACVEGALLRWGSALVSVKGDTEK